MKQLHYFFVVISISLITFSCEQLQEEINNQSDQEVTETTEPNTKITKKKAAKSKPPNKFLASMRNLKTINTYIEASNEQLIAAMDRTATIKTQYQPLFSTALQIQTITTTFHQYIYALKDLIAQESNGVYTQFDSEVKGNIDLIGMPKDGNNKEVIEQVFITGQYGGVNTQEQQGPVLYQKLNQLKTDYFEAVSSLWDNGGIKGSVFADTYKKEILLTELSGKLLLNASSISTDQETWVKENFSNKTTEETYISLTQFQNQVNLSTAAVLKSLSEQMGRLELNYDKFDVLAQSPKPYVLLGENYEAEIALGAYSSQAKFSVSVEGRGLSVIDGKARYSTRATAVGEHSYNAKISVNNPLTGETESFTKTFKYEVGQPAVMVAADKQNILYIGVDNPVTFAAAGITRSAIKVSIIGGVLKKVSSSGYIVTVTKPGDVIITIKNTKTGKSFPFKFRAKKIPNPIVKLGNQVDGMMSSNKFKTQTGLDALFEDFDYEAKCLVQSYALVYTRKRQDAIFLKGKGSSFTGKVIAAVRQAKPGDQYAFTEVQVRCSGDKTGRRVNGLSFMVK